ncbi:MAG: ATP synthase F1 subunit delta [Anaerohalosphaeraceae bacterium]
MAASSKHIIYEIYSDVLFQLAEESGQVEQVLEDMASVGSLLRDEPEFLKLIVSSKMKEDEKTAALRRVFSGRVNPLTLDFLCVLARRNRIGGLAGIADRYEVLVDSLKNCRLVEVVLAKQLSDTELEKLRLEIKDAIKAEVKLKVQIDPEILGGIMIRQGDMMIDNSVRTILTRTVNGIVDRSRDVFYKQKNNAGETTPNGSDSAQGV